MAAAAALGGIVQGVTGFMTASYQAQVANMNAKVAQANADRARDRWQKDAEDNDFQTAALLGEQEVAQAASGVSLSGKSQIRTRQSARILGRRDTLNIRDAGELDRYNYLVQKANFKAEASAAKISGVSSLLGGFLSAAGSLPSSMVGGSTSTAAPYKYVPQPIPKPTSISQYLNPLVRSRANFGR